MIRTRIAPSPTGIPHIGNTRTSLFNYAWAKHAGGEFILRIEDTDRARLVEGAEEKIQEILDWLGLTPDETYKQSERIDIYKEHAQKLLDQGIAFQDEGAIRFKTPKEGETSWTDAIGNKEITFKNSTQEDFVILKSDGYPTYNFANVIDDHLMEITHAIRGDEFISSTPKHIMLYEAFGWEHPVFAHLPLILGPDKSKLSKRHGAESVLELRDQGYLPEAVINFMAFLGWTPPSGKELLTLKEICAEFDLKDVNLSPPIFNTTKLTWLNAQYIKESSSESLESSIYEFFGHKYPQDLIQRTIPLVKERIKTLKEFDELIFPWLEPISTKFLAGENRIFAEQLLEYLEGVKNWEREDIFKAVHYFCIANKVNLRIAYAILIGKDHGLPMAEMLYILEKENVINRIKNGLALLS